jgi:hypothetical protein
VHEGRCEKCHLEAPAPEEAPPAAAGADRPRSARGGAARGDAAWEAQLARLAAYKAEHGDCNVPSRWVEDPQLGTWVGTQRKRKKQLDRGKPGCGLTAARVAKLEALGFAWRVSAAEIGRLIRQSKAGRDERTPEDDCGAAEGGQGRPGGSKRQRAGAKLPAAEAARALIQQSVGQRIEYKFAGGDGGVAAGEGWQWHGGRVVGRARWPGCAHHAFGLIGAALSQNIGVFHSSSPKVVPISPNAS